MIYADLLVNIIGIHLLVIIYFVIKILWKRNDAPQPQLFYREKSNIIHQIINKCTTLNERYIPVYLWGKSGHIQSIIFSIFGRIGRTPKHLCKRKELLAKDGTLVTYDTFYSMKEEKNEVIVVVPGIANHAETSYIKSFSQYMSSLGYTVIVFNHTGALKSVKLEKPKIFNYGQTEDLDLVIQTLRKEYRNQKFITIGFSLGGNILLKYLGENLERQNYFHFAASLCQGYDVTECCELMQDRENLRFVYNYGLTQKMLSVILRHKDTFEKHEPSLDWKKISSSKALHELDQEFTLKFSPEKNIKTFYENCSSSRFLSNIRIPVLILNAKDDPLIPETLYKYPKSLIGVNHDVLFVVTEYGGHLGFFENGYVIPNRITWLDRMLAQFVEVTLDVLKENQSLNKKLDFEN